MTKADFRALFLRALNIAAENAEHKLGEPVPRSFLIELHGAGCAGQTISPDEAIERMFIRDDRFYRIIDIAVREILPNNTAIFARVSGHHPAEFERTFDPSNLGPFKHVISEHVIDRRVHSE